MELKTNKEGIARHGATTVMQEAVRHQVKNDSKLLSKDPGGALKVGKAIFKKANENDFLDHILNERIDKAKEANLKPYLATALAAGTTLSVAKDEADKGEDAGSALLKGSLYAVPVVAGTNALVRGYQEHRAPGKGKDYLSEIKGKHEEAQKFHKEFVGKEHLLKEHTAEEFAKLPDAHKAEITNFHEKIISNRIHQGFRNALSGGPSNLNANLGGLLESTALHVGKAYNPEFKNKSHEEFLKHYAGDEYANNLLRTHKNYIKDQMSKAPSLEKFHENLAHLGKAGYSEHHINKSIGLMQMQKLDPVSELGHEGFHENKNVTRVLKSVAPKSHLKGLQASFKPKAESPAPLQSQGPLPVSTPRPSLDTLDSPLPSFKKPSILQRIKNPEKGVGSVSTPEGFDEVAIKRHTKEAPTRIIEPSSSSAHPVPGTLHIKGVGNTASRVLKDLRKIASRESIIEESQEDFLVSTIQAYFF